MSHVANRLLIVVNDISAVSEAVTKHGGVSRKITPAAHILDLPPNANIAAVMAQLKADPRITAVEFDEDVNLTTTSVNDPLYPHQWHLPHVNAPVAWDTNRGAGVIVAVVDSGVQASHPDLAANMIAGWNVYDNNSNSNDINGHGTAVAGVFGAVGNNGIGFASVAWNCKIMPIRAVDPSDNSTFSLVATAITWAADHGAKVINISFSNLYKSSTVISSAQYANSKGATVCVSANNNAINEGSAEVPSMIVVSATDKNNALASFSSWGPMVDMAAPGVDIETTLWNSQYNGLGAGAFGTSFATPIVAGTAALCYAANSLITPAAVKTTIMNTATDLGSAGRDIYFGAGLVNCAAAVAAAKIWVPPPPLPPPPTMPPPKQHGKH